MGTSKFDSFRLRRDYPDRSVQSYDGVPLTGDDIDSIDNFNRMRKALARITARNSFLPAEVSERVEHNKRGIHGGRIMNVGSLIDGVFIPVDQYRQDTIARMKGLIPRVVESDILASTQELFDQDKDTVVEKEPGRIIEFPKTAAQSLAQTAFTETPVDPTTFHS